MSHHHLLADNIKCINCHQNNITTKLELEKQQSAIYILLNKSKIFVRKSIFIHMQVVAGLKTKKVTVTDGSNNTCRSYISSGSTSNLCISWFKSSIWSCFFMDSTCGYKSPPIQPSISVSQSLWLTGSDDPWSYMKARSWG